MADTDLSISLAKGKEGFQHDDFTFGTLAPNAGMVEIRIAASVGGKKTRRLEVLKALEAFERVLGAQNTFSTDLAE